MLANNEIGTVQPVSEIGELVREIRSAGQRHLRFHTDAVQAIGRIGVDVETLVAICFQFLHTNYMHPKGLVRYLFGEGFVLLRKMLADIRNANEGLVPRQSRGSLLSERLQDSPDLS